MIHSSAILKSTVMDKIYGDATTLETVAKITAIPRQIRIKVTDANGNVVKNDDGSVKVNVEHKTFVAVNDLPAISIEQVDFGKASTMLVMLNDSYGANAVDAVLKSVLRTEFAYLEEDEFLTRLALDVQPQAVKDYLEFYKMLNA